MHDGSGAGAPVARPATDGAAEGETSPVDPIAQTALETLGPLRLPTAYCPLRPTAKQEWFLRQDAFDILYGGAAGGGKSLALLMSSLQYVNVGAYHAILLRPTLSEFEQPGALISISHEWLGGTDAHWDGTDRAWRFPSGSTVRFGYLSNVGHLARYKGPSYSFVGFDELTSFPEPLFRAMFRVLRQAKDEALADVPLRLRAATNPGDIGHEWVKARYVSRETREPGSLFIPATIRDNPYLDYDEYVRTSLSHLSPVDQLRLINGDWDVAEEGGKFHRDSFVLADATTAPAPAKMIRYWDLAGTAVSDTARDPDWTCGLLYSWDADDKFTIRDLVMLREDDSEVEAAVRACAELDGPGVDIYLEQDPGQAGKSQINNYRLRVLPGFPVYAGSTRIRGQHAAKEVRARPVAAAVANGLVRLLTTAGGQMRREFLNQCAMFPRNGTHDDAVDALSGAHNHITREAAPSDVPRRATMPRARIPSVLDRRTITDFGSTRGFR